MILIIVFSLLATYIPFLFIKNRKSKFYFRIIMIISNICLMFLSIFSFQLLRHLSIIGALICFYLSVLIIILNILFVITNIIKVKKIRELFFFDTNRIICFI